ncbi:hypothetical protein JCM8547_002501 [Rhodosporidiobolus lusitaniae]
MAINVRQLGQAQVLLLASFPFISMGVVGIFVATFLLSLGRVNRTHLNLWVSLGSAFLGGLFQLGNVLQGSDSSADPSTPLQLLPGIFIAQSIAIAFFVNFKLFFLYRRSAQPGLYDPPTPSFPLPPGREPIVVLEKLDEPPSPYAVYKKIGYKVLRPFVWVMILSTGFVDSTWRIGFRRNVIAFSKVHDASHALQLILQLAFFFKIIYKASRSPGRPRVFVFLSHLPLLVGILLGASIAIAALVLLGFTETPLGRLLLFLQMYIFLLETSLIDYKRPYRDSFSFERVSRRPSSSSDESEGNKAPALSRSPLDRAREAVVFSSSGQQASDLDSSRVDGTSLSSSTAGTGPILRRSSQPLPSWLPILRSPERYQQEPEALEERLSLTIDAALPATGGTDRSLLFVQAQQEQVARPPVSSRTDKTGVTSLSAYRFPESVDPNGEKGFCPLSEKEKEQDRIVFSSATPSTASTTPSSRRNRPTLTINTTLAIPSTGTSKVAVQKEKPLPALPDSTPPPPALFAEPTATDTGATTATATMAGSTVTSLLRNLPSALENPTRPLDLPKQRPSFVHGDSISSRLSEPISLVSTARSSRDVVGGGGETALVERFPYPPAAALIRTSSGRTGTTTSLGRIRTREGSEFELVPPKRLFVESEASSRAASEEGGGSETSTIRAGVDGGLDITSLFVGSDDAHELKEQLGTMEESAEGTGEATTSNGLAPPPVASQPVKSTLPPSMIPYRIPPAGGGSGLPISPSSTLLTRPSRIQPPRPWPPVRPVTPPSLAAPPPHDPLASSSLIVEARKASSASATSTTSSSTTYPPAPSNSPFSSRRPSAVALAAAQIRAEAGESLLPRPVMPAAQNGGGGGTAQGSPGSRMRRFMFPGGGGGGAERRETAVGGRIVVDPVDPFMHPRRVPDAMGEPFNPRRVGGKERSASEGSEVEIVVQDVLRRAEDEAKETSPKVGQAR